MSSNHTDTPVNVEIVIFRGNEQQHRELLEQAQEVRKAVFVDEHRLPAEIGANDDDYRADAIHIVLKVNGEVIGTTRAMAETYDDNSTVYSVSRVAVLPDHRNQGYGSKIFGALLADIKQQDPNVRGLRLVANYEARIFWSRLGFKYTGGKYHSAELDMDLIPMGQNMYPGNPSEGFCFFGNTTAAENQDWKAAAKKVDFNKASDQVKQALFPCGAGYGF